MFRRFTSFLCIIFFLCVHSRGDNVLTKFHLNGTLSCITNAGFRVPFVVWTLGIWEEDAISDDHLGDVYHFILTDAGAFYKTVVQDDGDGLGEPFYELFYKITHNCNIRGEKRESKVCLKKFHVENGDYYHLRNINLFTLAQDEVKCNVFN